jgi:hypothetical protein
MTQSATPFKTLEALRTDLQARIGGAAGISFNKPILNSFLQSAQEALYEATDWKHLRARKIITVANGSVWYDLPTDCNMEKVTLVAIEEAGRWTPLVEGIDLHRRNWYSSPATPTRYDVSWNADAANAWKVQIEIHPEPLLDGRMLVEYVRTLLPFTDDNHVASIPTGPLFLHALTNAKLHYRQPDGPQYAQQLEAMLMELKGRHRRKTVVTPRGGTRILDEDIAYLVPPTDYPGA